MAGVYNEQVLGWVSAEVVTVCRMV